MKALQPPCRTLIQPTDLSHAKSASRSELGRVTLFTAYLFLRAFAPLCHPYRTSTAILAAINRQFLPVDTRTLQSPFLVGRSRTHAVCHLKFASQCPVFLPLSRDDHRNA